jgi:hypothetical protein
VAQGLAAGLGQVTLGRLVHELLADVTEAQLNGGVAVGAVGFELGNPARTRLDHGDRDGSAFVVEELGHAQFLPKNADGHKEGETPAGPPLH